MAKPRILIVEDEAIIASVIAGALRKFGYEVIDILNNGETAAAVALEKNPDLVLMDLRMPGMDGLTAIQHLHTAQPHIAVPQAFGPPGRGGGRFDESMTPSVRTKVVGRHRPACMRAADNSSVRRATSSSRWFWYFFTSSVFR
mgnify:CR=1 FL=1